MEVQHWVALGDKGFLARREGSRGRDGAGKSWEKVVIGEWKIMLSGRHLKNKKVKKFLGIENETEGKGVCFAMEDCWRGLLWWKPAAGCCKASWLAYIKRRGWDDREEAVQGQRDYYGLWYSNCIHVSCPAEGCRGSGSPVGVALSCHETWKILSN